MFALNLFLCSWTHQGRPTVALPCLEKARSSMSGSPWGEQSPCAKAARKSTNHWCGCWEKTLDLIWGSGMLRMSKNTKKIPMPVEWRHLLKIFLYSKQLQIVFLIYWRPCDMVRNKNRLKLDLTALLWHMRTDVDVTSFLCPALSAHVSRQGMGKHNNFPL